MNSNSVIASEHGERGNPFWIASSFLLAMTLVIFSIPASADQQEIVSKVESALNSITTLTADFTQTDAEGKIAGGKFMLKRPGKFRWEYDERQPVEIVSDGHELVYYDKRLKETTYTSLKNSLAGFLARKNIKFSGDVQLLSVSDIEGITVVSVTQKERPEQGTLGLFFDDKTMHIKELDVANQNGGVTKVVFSNVEYGQPVEDSVFVFKDPKYSATSNVWDKK